MEARILRPVVVTDGPNRRSRAAAGRSKTLPGDRKAMVPGEFEVIGVVQLAQEVAETVG
ncbi:hypothetical protein OG873_10895 [Streptomyces violaceus]|uniref:Uncharacterized protein n=1 Tax=Streptomyces violaceus TaxID=1936 RepID=A0ABZ1NR00_STRVL